MNAIHRTCVHTSGVFRTDTRLGNYVGHRISRSKRTRACDLTNHLNKNAVIGTGCVRRTPSL
jgi:hypothetical protein